MGDRKPLGLFDGSKVDFKPVGKRESTIAETSSTIFRPSFEPLDSRTKFLSPPLKLDIPGSRRLDKVEKKRKKSNRTKPSSVRQRQRQDNSNSVFRLLEESSSLIASEQTVGDLTIRLLADNTRNQLKGYYGERTLEYNMNLLDEAIAKVQEDPNREFDLNTIDFVSDGTGTREMWMRDAMNTKRWSSEEMILMATEGYSLEQKKKQKEELKGYVEHIKSSPSLGSDLTEINDNYEALLFNYTSKHVDYQFDNIKSPQVTIENVVKKSTRMMELNEASKKLDAGSKKIATKVTKLLLDYDSTVTETLSKSEHKIKMRENVDDSLFSVPNMDLELEFKRVVNLETVTPTDDLVQERTKSEELLLGEIKADSIVEEISKITEQFEGSLQTKSIHLTLEMIWDDHRANVVNNVTTSSIYKDICDREYYDLSLEETLTFWAACLSIMFGADKSMWNEGFGSSVSEKEQSSPNINIGPKEGEKVQTPSADPDVGIFARPRVKLSEKQAQLLETALVEEMWTEMGTFRLPNPELDEKTHNVVEQLKEEMFVESITRRKGREGFLLDKREDLPEYAFKSVSTMCKSLAASYVGMPGLDLHKFRFTPKYYEFLSVLEYHQIRESIHNVCQLRSGGDPGKVLENLLRETGTPEEIAARIRENRGDVTNEKWRTYVLEVLGTLGLPTFITPNDIANAKASVTTTTTTTTTTTPPKRPKDFDNNGEILLDLFNRREKEIRDSGNSLSEEQRLHLARSGNIEDWSNTRSSFWKPFAMMVKEDWGMNVTHSINTPIKIKRLQDRCIKYFTDRGLEVRKEFMNLWTFVYHLGLTDYEFPSTGEKILTRKEVIRRIGGKKTVTLAIIARTHYGRSDRSNIVRGLAYTLGTLYVNRLYVHEKWIAPINKFLNKKIAESSVHSRVKKAINEGIGGFKSLFPIDKLKNLASKDTLVTWTQFGACALVGMLLYYVSQMLGICATSYTSASSNEYPTTTTTTTVTPTNLTITPELPPKVHIRSELDENTSPWDDKVAWYMSPGIHTDTMMSSIYDTPMIQTQLQEQASNWNNFKLPQSESLTQDHVKGFTTLNEAAKLNLQRAGNPEAAEKIDEFFQRTSFGADIPLDIRADDLRDLPTKKIIEEKFKDWLKLIQTSIFSGSDTNITTLSRSVTENNLTQAGKEFNRTNVIAPLQILFESSHRGQKIHLPKEPHLLDPLLNFLGYFKSPFSSYKKDLFLSETGEAYSQSTNDQGIPTLNIHDSSVDVRTITYQRNATMSLDAATSYGMERLLRADGRVLELEVSNLKSAYITTRNSLVGAGGEFEKADKKEKMRLEKLKDSLEGEEAKTQKERDPTIAERTIRCLLKVGVAIMTANVHSVGILVAQASKSALSHAAARMLYSVPLGLQYAAKGREFSEGWEASENGFYATKSIIDTSMSCVGKWMMFPFKMVVAATTMNMISNQLLVASVLTAAEEFGYTNATKGLLLPSVLILNSLSSIRTNYIRKTVVDNNARAMQDIASVILAVQEEGLGLETFSSRSSWLDPRWISHILREGNLVPLMVFFATSLSEYNSWRTYKLLEGNPGIHLDVHGYPVEGITPTSQFSIGQQFWAESNYNNYISPGWWSLIPGVWLLTKNLLTVYQNNVYADTQTLMETKVRQESNSIKSGVDYYETHYSGWFSTQSRLVRMVTKKQSNIDLERMKSILEEIGKINNNLTYLKKAADRNPETEDRYQEILEKRTFEYNELDAKTTVALNNRFGNYRLYNSLLECFGTCWVLGYFVQIATKSFSFPNLPPRSEMISTLTSIDRTNLNGINAPFLMDPRAGIGEDISLAPDYPIQSLRAHVQSINDYSLSFDPLQNQTLTERGVTEMTESVTEICKWFAYLCTNNYAFAAVFGAGATMEVVDMYSSWMFTLEKWRVGMSKQIEANNKMKNRVTQQQMDLINRGSIKRK